MKEKTKGAQTLWDRYKYAALVALIGAGLLLWPTLGGREEISSRQESGSEASGSGSGRDAETVQRELEEILGAMSGVGQVKVMLTVDSDGERQLAQNTTLSYSGSAAAPEDYSRRSEAVLVNGGGGNETVTTRTTYPTYRGALVVCGGGDRAEVRLAVTEAVAALTGLPSDRITVAAADLQ